MSKEDVEKAVKEAEQFAAEDAKRKEEVDTRNQADQMVYQSEKAMEEMKDKLDASEVSELEAEINKVKEALKGTDTQAIKTATESLTQAFYKVSEKMYQQANPQEMCIRDRYCPAHSSGRQNRGPGLCGADHRHPGAGEEAPKFTQQPLRRSAAAGGHRPGLGGQARHYFGR